jgi:hypothetical protein
LWTFNYFCKFERERPEKVKDMVEVYPGQGFSTENGSAFREKSSQLLSST